MKKLNLWTILMALFVAFSMAACDEKGDDGSNEPDVPKPPTTVDDDDWQAVPSSGGTIEKDSISITFPSGTFSGDTKVAISNVSKGKIYGDLEVSPFYQITMPVTTKRATTIKIKSQKLDDDVSFVFHSAGLARSAGQVLETNTFLETTYYNGEYIATLPIFENEEESATDFFAVGLARAHDDSQTRGATPHRATLNGEGQVKGIKWKLYTDKSAYDFWNWDKVTMGSDLEKMIKNITDALTIITDLGFTLQDKDRVIPYYYISDSSKWGYFVQDKWHDSRSYIGISVNLLYSAKSSGDEFSMPCTVLHETFHYFQADYDNRCATKKAGGLYGTGYYYDNEGILYEMGAVWIEQFVNNGQLNASFLKETVFGDVFYTGDDVNGKGDKLGFGYELSRWGNGEDTGYNRLECNQQQGYTMGPILYYITTEMSAWNFYKTSVVDLHRLWREKWKSDKYNSYYILDEWVKSHYSDFFLDDSIDKYWLKLWEGKLVKDFCIADLFGRNVFFIKDKNKKFVLGDDCYPYGCGVRMVTLQGFKDTPLNDKELVIKQENANVHTYVIYSSKNSNYKTFREVQKDGAIRCVAVGDSIVIKGSTLEQMREADGNLDTEFFLITTNIENQMHSKVINPYKVSIELRDKEEDVNNVTPFRTNFSLGVKYFEEVTRDGNTTTSETYNEELPFGFANINGYDKEITTTVDGTTLKVSCINEERGMKETLSYDILNFNDNKKMKVANLVYTLHSEGEHYVSGDGNVDVVRDYTIKIYGQLSFTRSNPGGGMQEYDFGLSETINSTNIYYEDKRINKRKWSEEVTSTVEWKLVPNTTFNAYLSFEFYP